MEMKLMDHVGYSECCFETWVHNYKNIDNSA